MRGVYSFEQESYRVTVGESSWLFFFQAEDGIRDRHVTGVQTCALPICSRIGDTFDAIVTGVTEHGTFVRVLKPHVEGLLARGQQGADVGDRLRVKLISTDVERGYIDFARSGH